MSEKRISALGVVIWTFLGLGGHHIYHTQYVERSAMTWMYERMNYAQLKPSRFPELAHSYYGCYFYGEGRYYYQHEKLDHLTGHPVLYVPGSGGSYKQARNVGTVLYKKMKEDKTFDFHFNMFTINYNEELSAFYGGTIEQQTDFMAKSVRAILSLYRAGGDRKLAIVAHSMGGVVVRAALARGLLTSDEIMLYVTLGSPHQYSIISVPTLQRFTKTANVPTNVPCVSVSGGIRDLQVRPAITMVDECINTRAESLYGSWFSHDHQSLVWDNNLNRAVCRSIYDATYARINGHSVNEVLQFHFDKKFSPTNKYHLARREQLDLGMVDIASIKVNMDTVNANGAIGMGQSGKYVINLGELKRKFTRILIISKQHAVSFNGDAQIDGIILPDQRQLTMVNLTSLEMSDELGEEFWASSSRSTLTVTTQSLGFIKFIIDEVDQLQVAHTMSTFVRYIPYFRYIYSLGNDEVNVVQLTGWSSTYQVFELALDQPGITIFRHNQQNAIISTDQSVKLSLTRGDPSDVELILIGKMSQAELSVNFSAVNDLLIREYHSVIIAFIVVNMLFLCASYVRGKNQTRNLWDVLELIGKPYYICPMLAIAHGAFNRTWLESIVPRRDSPLAPDSEILAERHLYFSTVYIICFIIGRVILGTVAKVIFYFVWLSRYVLGSVATVMHKLFGYNYIMMPLCAALLMVQGTFALFPLVIIEYFNLIYLIRTNPIQWKQPKSSYWLYFLRFCLLILQLMLLLPIFVFWAKNYQFAPLPSDPTFIPSMLTIGACFSENLQHEFDIPRLPIIWASAAFVGLYCTINVHRVLFIIPLIIWLLNQSKSVQIATSQLDIS